MTQESGRRKITVVEVGPRDGLQNERAFVATADKIAFVDLLSEAGLSAIEVTSFVSPKWVPQLQDAADVCAGIARRGHVRYSALVPNMAGFERAAAAGLREIAIVVAASDTFNRKNINQGTEDALKQYARLCHCALAAGMRVRGYLSTAFGCPYEGEIAPEAVATLAERLVALGIFEVAVSDTIGIAHPGQVPVVLEPLLARIGAGRVALHFHDTRGMALANVLAALSLGIATFDASAGGLGGCPFAPGAAGNLATDDLVYMLDGLGIDTGISLERLTEASRFIASRVGHPPSSRYAQAATAHRATSETTEDEGNN